MTRQFRFVRPFLVSMFILLSLSRPAAGQEVMFPHGDLSDSAFAYAAGVDALTHAFGADTLAYPNEFPLPSTFPAFSAVFDLYLTDSVSDRWSKSEWEDIIGAIMNNDTTDTNDDVFGIVWGYFA